MDVDNEQRGHIFIIRTDENISCGAALLKKVLETTMSIVNSHLV